MILSNTRSVLSLVLVSILSISCGFHLRGSTPAAQTSLSQLYIYEEDLSPVGNELETLLEINGTSVVAERALANFHLTLHDYNIEQTVLSVSAATGKAEEYQIQLTIWMTVTDRDEIEVINNQLIRITRDYAFDDTAVLGSVTERDVLINDLTKLAAAQIIRVLDTIND